MYAHLQIRLDLASYDDLELFEVEIDSVSQLLQVPTEPRDFFSKATDLRIHYVLLRLLS